MTSARGIRFDLAQVRFDDYGRTLILDRKTAEALHAMLGEADVGFLIHAPQNVIDEFPQFRPVDTLEQLKGAFAEASDRDLVL